MADRLPGAPALADVSLIVDLVLRRIVESVQCRRKAQVDLGQGFLIGKSMQADQFAQYLVETQQRADEQLRRKQA